MSSPSAFERRQGIQGPTGPTGPAGPSGPSGPTGPPSPAITLSGNTTGTLALVSSGTLTLAGGNNITLSQSGNHITISGANVGGAQTAISGIANSETTYTSGTISLVQSGNITINSTTGQKFVFSVPTQSVQPETQTFIAGVSASNTLYTSGNVRISGSNAVTVKSGTGQLVVIDVPTQTTQVETQTFVGGVAGSNTTYTSGTALFSGVGGGITVSSNTGQRIDLSVAAQTNQAGSVYASSNTFGTSSGTYDARSISIAGRGAVSVAASNSGWIISAPAQSVQAETQTFVGGVAGSNTTYTSGTISLTGVGGGVTVSSNTGQRIDISVAAPVAQTVQTQNLIDVTLAGNSTSAGAGYALISSGTMTLAGGANITLSQNGNAVSISGGAGGGFSAGMSTEGNTAGNTGVTGTRLVLVGTGPVSLSQTTGAAGGTVSINAPATSSLSATGAVSISVNASTISIGAPVQTDQSGNIYASSNTFGTSSGTYDARSISIAGRGAVSVAASNSGWIVSAPVQSAQTGVSGIANSQTTYTSGTVSLSELGAITIRSTTGNQFQLSVNSQTVQTQNVVDVTLAGNSTSAGGGYALISSGTLTLAGGANVTLSQNANAVTISAGGGAETQVAISGIRASDTTYTSGSVTITGVGGGVTVNSNTGQRVDISVAAPVAQTNQSGNVYASSNTFGTSSGTYDARSISIAGRGAVSVAASNSGWIVSAPVQTAETAISGIANSETTYTSGTVSLSALGALTIRSTTGNQFQLSVNSQTAQTGISGLSNSNTTFTSGTVGLSELGAITIRSTTGNQFQFSVNSQTVQTQNIMQVTASGNRTSGGGGYVVISTGTMALAGGPNVTLSQDGNTISISGGAGAGGGVAVAGSNTTYTSGTALFSGVGGGITVSSNTGQRIDLSVAAPIAQTNQSGNVYASSNTTGTSSGTYDARSISIAGAGAVSVAASNSGWVVSAPATSSLVQGDDISISTNGSTITIGRKNNLADWQNGKMGDAIVMTHVSAISKTPFYWNDHIDGDLTAKSLAFRISMVTATQPLSVSVHLGVYTFANSTLANLLGSHSEAYVVSSATSASLSGVRNMIMTGIGTHATLSTISGGEYMLGMMFSATATNAMNFSLYGANAGAGPLGGLYPGTNNVSAGTSQGVQAMLGRGSTTVNAMPAAVQASEVVNYGQGASMQLHPWIYIRS